MATDASLPTQSKMASIVLRPVSLSGTVYSDQNNNGVRDASERSATTDANGAFQFGNLGAGSYPVRVVPPAGFVETTGSAAPIMPQSGQNASVAVGTFQTVTVSGEVFDDTPASKAGLQAGDVVTSVGGKAVKEGRALQNLVAALPLKKAVDLKVFRDGKTLTVPVTIDRAEIPLDADLSLFVSWFRDLVRATEAATVSMSSGRNERRSTTSTSRSCSRSSRSAAATARPLA